MLENTTVCCFLELLVKVGNSDYQAGLLEDAIYANAKTFKPYRPERIYGEIRILFHPPPAGRCYCLLGARGLAMRMGLGHRVSGVKGLFDDTALLCEALEYITYKSSNSEKEKALRLLGSLNVAK